MLQKYGYVDESLKIYGHQNFKFSCQYVKFRNISVSGRPEEFHLQSPSDPCVTVSRHTAPIIQLMTNIISLAIF